MKKFLLGSLTLLAAMCGTLSADSFVHAWNRCDQILSCDDTVKFECKFKHHIDLVNNGKEFLFNRPGTYLVTYTLVGTRFDKNSEPSLNSKATPVIGQPIAGEWCAQLLKDGCSVEGGDVCVTSVSGTERLEAVGIAIIKVEKLQNIQITVCGDNESDVLIEQATICITSIEEED